MIFMISNNEKIKTIDELERIVDELRKNNKKIVFTNGCFDILHVGHVRYLNEARKLGDVLVVAVNSDSSVKHIKGKDRPVNGEKDRAEVLASLACVDYVTIFSDDTPIGLITRLKPNVHVKGGDWAVDKLPEKSVVESYGGKIVIVKQQDGYSTTAIIEKTRKKQK
jgi:glycerol-3-phosphate cytidylyltransferase